MGIHFVTAVSLFKRNFVVYFLHSSSGGLVAEIFSNNLHHHLMCLVCPDALSLVGDPFFGKRVWFTESHIVLVVSFYLFYLFISFLL